jgi:hypothetical protein
VISGKKPLTKIDIAKLGERLKDYETLYSYLSDIDHVSPIGLAEYVQLDPSTRRPRPRRFAMAPLRFRFITLFCGLARFF